jgi:ABC-type methionine transport system permease subunit
MKNIGIIGSGFVLESAMGEGFHRLGHDVLFYVIIMIIEVRRIYHKLCLSSLT